MSLVVLVVRLYVRRKVFGKFKADDYLVALAWLFFFATTITWTILGGELYMTIDAESGNPEAAILKYLKVYAQALNATLGTYFCTWTSLYVVKLSFMVFFHGLGNKIKAQSILWWCVLGFIVASYVISVGMFDYGCLASDWENIIGMYSPQTLPLSRKAKYSLTESQRSELYWKQSAQPRICHHARVDNTRCCHRYAEYL